MPCLYKEDKVAAFFPWYGRQGVPCLYKEDRIGAYFLWRVETRHGEIHLCAFVVYVFYSVDCAVGMCGYSCEAAEAAVS